MNAKGCCGENGLKIFLQDRVICIWANELSLGKYAALGGKRDCPSMATAGIPLAAYNRRQADGMCTTAASQRHGLFSFNLPIAHLEACFE